MKLSTAWLREWINPLRTNDALAELLIQAGLEIEESCVEDGEEIWTIKITPNRGDALSLLGIARELSIASDLPLPKYSPAVKLINSMPFSNLDPQFCPYYSAQHLTHLNPEANTPPWMALRLQQAGIKLISLVVDVTQFVMLELGQPLHAFDYQQVAQGLEVRQAAQGESLQLLNDRVLELTRDDRVVASGGRAVALAGIMGGASSGAHKSTEVILEAAHFQALPLRASAARHQLKTDAAYRFERGVDPYLPERALARANQLLMEYGGAIRAGQICFDQRARYCPPVSVILSLVEISRTLGFELDKEECQALLEKLDIKTRFADEVFHLIIPSWRMDLAQDIDIIEEIARLKGFEYIPEALPQQTLQVPKIALLARPLRSLWVSNGYSEVINYSFNDPDYFALFESNARYHQLINPLSQDRSALRRSLWPGLVETARYNRARQHQSIKIFETGVCFKHANPQQQSEMLAGLVWGLQAPHNWTQPTRAADFFDIKADVLAYLQAFTVIDRIVFKPTTLPALHPGQAAIIELDGQSLGVIGQCHPEISRKLDFHEPIFLFELDLAPINSLKKQAFQAVSKYPQIKRDIALMMADTLHADVVVQAIRNVAGPLLKEVVVFDHYQGPGIEPKHISLALSLYWQDPTRTLQEAEVHSATDTILQHLAQRYGIALRQ